jgi:N-acetylated-alpha-linked acidic dipeptidase
MVSFLEDKEMEIPFRKGHEAFEKKVLENLSINEPQALLNRFSTLIRSSGKEDEFKAASYIVDRLKHFGISHHLYEPTLYISLPVKSSLQVREGDSWEDIRCTSPSFSCSTAPEWVEAQGAMTKATVREEDDYVFDPTIVDPNTNVKGKIAFCEGTFSPAMVRTLEDMGADGIVMINPGERIHESNCSTVWGTPTLENMDRLPGVPIVSISRPDGDRLIKKLKDGGISLRMRTEMDVGWRRCLMPVAEIRGLDEPDSFILVHGHLDSWYYGLCDNGTGNATLLELARVLHEARDGLGRSVRFAWWPGHSHGRYAGSTWYADHFAMDLEENCVAQINIDSPGAQWATSYEKAMFMAEAAAFAKETIQELVGQRPVGRRPQRAGDYSFNNIGVTSIYMALSEIPDDVRKEKGFYPVGGNAGHNISWHTDQDIMDYVDLDNLMRDMKVYAATICRLANALLLPYDFRETTASHRARLEYYQKAGGSRFDLGPAIQAARKLYDDLQRFYASAERALESAPDVSAFSMRKYNHLLLALGRALIPIDYVNLPRFEHDPAVPIPPLGRLEPIKDLPGLDNDPHLQNITINTLLRRRNQIVSVYKEIRRRLETEL